MGTKELVEQASKLSDARLVAVAFAFRKMTNVRDARDIKQFDKEYGVLVDEIEKRNLIKKD
jgi:hypothetical protein